MRASYVEEIGDAEMRRLVLGLLVVGLDMNRALGIAAASGVAMTMLASVTLLPAVLGFVGRGIDRFGLPHRRRAAQKGGIWRRSGVVQRRPAVAALAGLAILVALALPTFGMRLGFGDAGNRPTTDTTRRASDLLAEGFGPGANGPLFLAESVGDEVDRSALQTLAARLRSVEGVAGATPASFGPGGDVALMQVFPTAPQDQATADLVHRLRARMPDLVGPNGPTVYVGGASAAGIGFAAFSASRLPLFIAVVLAVSFVVPRTGLRAAAIEIRGQRSMGVDVRSPSEGADPRTIGVR